MTRGDHVNMHHHKRKDARTGICFSSFRWLSCFIFFLSAVAVAENTADGMDQNSEQRSQNDTPAGIVDNPGTVAARHIKSFQVGQTTVGFGMALTAGQRLALGRYHVRDGKNIGRFDKVKFTTEP